MDASNYNKLIDIFESSKSSSSPIENDSNSLKDFFNQDKEEKKIENNNSSESNSGKSTESNKDSEKDKKEGENLSDSSKKEEKYEKILKKQNIPKKRDKIKIKKKFSLGRNVSSFKKKTFKIEIQNMHFLFGEKALQMFELLNIIKVKTPKDKSGNFEVFMRKKHMKIFSEFPFFIKEKGIINSEGAEFLYQENIEIEEFNAPFMNNEDNIFENNINNNDEDVINMENIGAINDNHPGHNIMPNEEIDNPFGQLTMVSLNQNLSIFSVDGTAANTI